MDAVPRLAHAAAHRIGAGALNGRSVARLAAEFGVTERHLRRALEREIGVSPVELAQTHRLLLAKRLLADTTLPVTRIAYASGFQSLRRFNTVFREQYRLSPSALRRALRRDDDHPGARQGASFSPPEHDFLRLTLAYRPPLAWEILVDLLGRDAIPGVEIVQGRRYGRIVRLEGRSGIVFVEDAVPANGKDGRRGETAHVDVDISPSLLPALMPLLARVRQLFDLDAEPAAVDACLERGGLGALVRRRRGLRIPGGFEGFEVACRILLRGRARPGLTLNEPFGRVTRTLGEPLKTGIPGLTRLAPGAARVAEAGSSMLMSLGVPRRRARALTTVARRVARGDLRLEPGSDVAATRRQLMEIDGVGERLATSIVMRALSWPDAFTTSDPAVLRAAGASSPGQLRERAEKWRPWRAYAAIHLWLKDGEG